MSQPLTLRTESGDEHVDLAEFEARVRRGEVSPQSLVRVPAVTGDSFVPACELKLYQSLHEPRRAFFARTFSIARFPWMTSALILLNLSVYLYTVRGGQMDFDDMVRFGGKVGPLVTDLGELWRLLTANFLHRDALHLGLNMFVLFNVGGFLENTYRTLDYLWLLVFSGIATMTMSLFLSDAVSIGASGMVYGCLGGVVVFGLKYRGLLPSRYRRVVGEAAIPTVLGLLLMGMTSKGIDNWAHVGGLLAGMICAAFMRPRLLTEPAPWWSPALRAAPSLGILACVLFGQQLLGESLPVLRLERDDTFGISVPVPRAWLKGANPLGSLAWYNGLPGLGRASFAAEAVQIGNGSLMADAAASARAFIDERLNPVALGPDVFKVVPEGPVTARLGDRDALKVSAKFYEPQGATRLTVYFVPCGELVYQLVFTFPDEFPRYGHVAEAMVAGIRFDEPKLLREARAKALLFPNAPPVLGRLGGALLRDGEPAAAADALGAAVRGEPGDVTSRRELALALLQMGEIERACEASAAAVLYAPEDPWVLEADARCEVARGNVPRALERIASARLLLPKDDRLKAAEQRLEAELRTSNAGARPSSLK